MYLSLQRVLAPPTHTLVAVYIGSLLHEGGGVCGEAWTHVHSCPQTGWLRHCYCCELITIPVCNSIMSTSLLKL